jgi:hypothetical protein
MRRPNEALDCLDTAAVVVMFVVAWSLWLRGGMGRRREGGSEG